VPEFEMDRRITVNELRSLRNTKKAVSKISLLKIQEKDSKMKNENNVKVSAHEEKEGTFVGVRRSEREKHHHFGKIIIIK
jgi:hypothetical protein